MCRPTVQRLSPVTMPARSIASAVTRFCITAMTISGLAMSISTHLGHGSQS